jgi:hypothetical protein
METALSLTKFAALNGATLLAACGFASRLPLQSKAQRLLAVCVLAVGIANLCGLALGLSGMLRYGPVLGSQLVLAAIGAALARWTVVRDFLDPRPLWALVDGPLQRLSLILLAIAYGYALFLGYVGETFAGDDLMYHLPLVAAYARQGSITIPELGSYWCNRFWAYYPGGAYVIYQWFVLPFGTGKLVDLVQYPFAFATGLASYVLARSIGARRRDALWALILFLAVPIVVDQVKTALVDVLLSFLFAAGLAFLLVQPLGLTGIALAAIAWGAAPGVKLPAMMYIGLGALCVALNQLDRDKSVGAALRSLVPAGAAIGIGMVVLSGYWFARNYLLMGSAVYPLNLHPEPPPVWSNILAYGLLFPLLDFSPAAPQVFNYETGAGPQFICLAVPALIAYGIAAARERRLGGIAFAVLPIAAYFVWLLRLSTSVQTLLRYVAPAMPLGFAAFAWLLPRLRQRALMGGVAFACVAFSFLIAVPHLGTYNNAESLRLGLVKWRRGEATKRFDVMGSVDLQDYRRAWAFLDGLPGAHDVAASHLIFTYPMMGADFRHRLHFLDAHEPQAWKAALAQKHVDYVALAEFVDSTGEVILGNPIELSLAFQPAGDEYVHVQRSLTPPRAIQALRLSYSGKGTENGRLLVGVNRFSQMWELPLSEGGTRSEVIAWQGELADLEFALEFTAQTSLRARIGARLENVEVQGTDGEWSELPQNDYGAWQVLRWPVEYYWMEAQPERFKLVMRDTDYWRSSYSGEMRLYQVVRERGGDGAQD